MDYTQSGSDILLKQPDFGLDDTLDCGQAFDRVSFSEKRRLSSP